MTLTSKEIDKILENKDIYKEIENIRCKIRNIDYSISDLSSEKYELEEKLQSLEEYKEEALEVACGIKCLFHKNPKKCIKKNKDRCPFVLSQEICKWLR